MSEEIIVETEIGFLEISVTMDSQTNEILDRMGHQRTEASITYNNEYTSGIQTVSLNQPYIILLEPAEYELFAKIGIVESKTIKIRIESGVVSNVTFTFGTKSE